MIIEIEKKYNITDHDIKIIDQKCEFVSEKTIIDQFLDTPDYKIVKSGKKVRIRNGKPELKIKISDNAVDSFSKSEEHTTDEEIKKVLSEMGIKFEDLKEILIIKTNRKKYTYNFDGLDFIIDIDKFGYGNRYEIELTFDDKGIDNASDLIDNFRKHLGLTGEQNLGHGKVADCAKEDNQELYEIIIKTEGGKNIKH